MNRYLNPGNYNFQITLKGKIYVDKSMLIKFTNENIFAQDDRFICVSRPRRFGKSMTADMLSAYYSLGCSSHDLFKDLNIARDETFEKHLNSYNVVQITVADFDDSKKSVNAIIDDISDSIIYEIRDQYPSIVFEKKDLMSVLDQVYIETGIPFVFIIDEWDWFFREREFDGDGQKSYLDFLRKLLKNKRYIALCYMTGIFPVKKYGNETALNMFREYSMTNMAPIEEYTGFTEEEVMKLCDKYKCDYSKIKEWYNGYEVNGISIYNPKSVVEALTRGTLRSYWTQTQTFEALKSYINTNMDDVKDAIVKMLAGESVPVDTSTFTNSVSNLENRNDVLTLLIHLGYLTYSLKDDKETTKIPNREVKDQFVSTIKEIGWSRVANALEKSEDLLNATLDKNEEKVAQLLDDAHKENTSILEYNDENSLACVISIAYYVAMKDYDIIREMPGGKGFADLLFKPKMGTSLPAMIIELKYNKSANTAINQIKENSYPDSLRDYKGNIELVGINYDKKTKQHACKIETFKK